MILSTFLSVLQSASVLLSFLLSALQLLFLSLLLSWSVRRCVVSRVSPFWSSVLLVP